VTAPGRWPAWPGEPETCTCTRMVVATIKETLGCPERWGYVPGIGWVHVLTGRRRRQVPALAGAGAR